MPVTGEATDTIRAAQMMREMDLSAIVVLGGDGTHRLVVRECGNIPISGVSSGTNNAFPTLVEPTVIGLAAGLTVTGRIPSSVAYFANKYLEIRHNGERDIALVDVAVSSDRFIGAKAVWHPESLQQLYTAFAEPDAIGLSAIAGLLEPTGREVPNGVRVNFSPVDSEEIILDATIAPGLLSQFYIQTVSPFLPETPDRPIRTEGVLVLDGERERVFTAGDDLTITLHTAAFHTIETKRCMRFAAQQGLFTQIPYRLRSDFNS